MLSKLFAALTGLILIEWLRQRHPMRGSVSEAIQVVQQNWNETLWQWVISLCPVRRRDERQLSSDHSVDKILAESSSPVGLIG